MRCCMRVLIKAFILSLFFFMVPVDQAEAHHSTGAVYDMRKIETLSGTVKSVKIVNPHGALVLLVKKADGTLSEWAAATGGARSLIERGFGKSGANELKVGDAVTVTYNPARSGGPVGWLISVTLPDGRKINMMGER